MPRVNKGYRLEVNARGVYEIRWTEGGRSHRLSTRQTGILEAAEFLRGFASTGAGPGADPAGPGSVRVRDMWDWYDAEHVEAAVRDKARLRDCWKVLGPHFGHLRLAEVTPAAVLAYREARAGGTLGRAVKDTTIRKELITLGSALRWGARTRRWGEAVVPVLELPPPGVPKAVWLDEATEARFLAAAARRSPPEGQGRLSRLHLFVAIGLDTAARRRAIETLRWEQVDTLRWLVDFRDREHRGNKRRAAVPVSARLRPVLERALREREAGAEWVLYEPGAIKTSFIRFAAGLGLEWVTPHVMRHTWATLALRAGAPVWDVAGVLGDTVETVTKVYGHHCPEHLRAVVDVRAGAGVGAPAEAKRGAA